MNTTRLIACRECDCLQEDPGVLDGTARCLRCDAVLYSNRPDSLNTSLALVLTAAVLLILANAFPILGLEIQGSHTETSLSGAAFKLWDEEMHMLAALVLATTVVVPTAEIVAITWILLPLRLGEQPRGARHVLRVMQALRPWGMVEVFMLGVLVALVKLAHMATVVPGVSLWSFAALMVVMTAVAASMNPRDVWDRLEAQAP